MVRAKFRVGQVRNVVLDDQVAAKDVEMWAVTTGSAENEAFFDATPNGHITMRIRNQVAADAFRQGQELYVDFTPAN